MSVYILFKGEHENGHRPGTPRPRRREQAGYAYEIEKNLKRVYEASLTETVPDCFLQVLADLREKEIKA